MTPMNDSKVKDEIAKEIGKTLLTCVAGGSVAGTLLAGAGSLFLIRAIAKPRPRNIEEAIQLISEDIVNDVSSFIKDHPDSIEIGASTSALLDFMDTLRAAKLTIDSLVDMKLDPNNLKKYLGNHKANDMRLASIKRQSVYEGAIKRFCDEIFLVASNLPGFQLALGRVLLRRQDELFHLYKRESD